MQMLKSAELGSNIQAFIVLYMRDAVSNVAIEQPVETQAFVRYPGESDFVLFQTPMRSLSGGYTVYLGNASALLPSGLNPADNIEFSIEVNARGYEHFQTTLMVNASQLIPVDTTVTTLQHSVEARLINTPFIQHTVDLQPNPVGLQGAVIDDNDFSVPIAGVNVRVIDPVIAPAVTSDTQGRYRIDTLPVASRVTLEVDNLGQVTTFQHIVDFATPLNTRIISLNG
jgi:hypothetical protein